MTLFFLQAPEPHVMCPQCRERHLVDPHDGIRSFRLNPYILEFIQNKTKDKLQEPDDSYRPQFKRCPEHNRERTQFCLSDGCNKAICPKCAGNHRHHNIVEIEEHHEARMKSVNEALELIVNTKTKLTDCKNQIQLQGTANRLYLARGTIFDLVSKGFQDLIDKAKTETAKTQSLLEEKCKHLDGEYERMKEMQKTFSNIYDGPFDFKVTVQSIKDDIDSILSDIGKLDNGVYSLDRDSIEQAVSAIFAKIQRTRLPLQALKGIDHDNHSLETNDKRPEMKSLSQLQPVGGNVQNTQSTGSPPQSSVPHAPSVGFRPQHSAANGPNTQSGQIPPQTPATSASNARNTFRSVLNAATSQRAHPYHHEARPQNRHGAGIQPQAQTSVTNASNLQSVVHPPQTIRASILDRPQPPNLPQTIRSILDRPRPRNPSALLRVLLEDGTDVTNNLNLLAPGTIIKVSRHDGAHLLATWNGTNIRLSSNHNRK